MTLSSKRFCSIHSIGDGFMSIGLDKDKNKFVVLPVRQIAKELRFHNLPQKADLCSLKLLDGNCGLSNR